MDYRHSWTCHWWAVALMGLIVWSIGDRPLVFLFPCAYVSPMSMYSLLFAYVRYAIPPMSCFLLEMIVLLG